MFTTITNTLKHNFLGVGVSLLLVASVVVPSAMLAQQATPEESAPTFEASKEPENTPPAPAPTPEPEPTTGGGDSGPTVEEDCDADIRDFLKNPDGTPFSPLDGTSNISDNGSQASVSVKNFSQTCSYNVHLAAYNVFVGWGQPDFVSTQTVFDSESEVVAPGETYTFNTPVPSCVRQLDLFEGPNVPQTNPDFANPPLINTHAMLDFDLTSGGGIPLCAPVEPPTCVPNAAGDLRAPDGSPFDPYNNSRVVITGSTASITVKNFSESCDYDGRLASYNVFDQWGTPEFISTQTLFDDTVTSIPHGQTRTLTVSLPSCATQIDFFTGPYTPQTNPDFAHPPLLNTHHLFDWGARLTPLCVPSNPAQLRVVKTVINDNGGVKQVSDFTLYVDATQVLSGVTNTFTAGTHTVREDQLPGYTAGLWGGDCSANGSVTLVAGQTKTCTIVNNDNPVVPNPAYIKVIKTVINDDGGIKQVSDFKLYVNNALVLSGATNPFPVGAYTVREDQLPGYTAGVWGGDCTANGVVTLVAGQTKTCTITNNDNPVLPNPAYVKVIKTVINDDGGIKQVSDFNLYVGSTQVVSGATNAFPAGAHTVREDQLPGYTAGVWGGDCSANGSVTLVVGQTKTCTITNNDNPIISNPAYIKLIKTVINDDGGTKQVSDFKLYVNNTLVVSEATNAFPAGAYTVHEDQLSGYTAGNWGGDCAENGTVTLVAGQTKTCTITNNDNRGGGDDDDDDDDDNGGGGGGGSSRRPKVVLFSTPQVLGSSISLTQVPYTGFGTSLLQILLFVVGLLAISGGVTYVIVRRRDGDFTAVVPAPVHNTYTTKETTTVVEESLPEVDALSAYDEYVSRDETIPAYTATYEHNIEKQASVEAPVNLPMDLPVAPATPVATVVAQSRATQMVVEHKQAVAQNTASLARLQDIARASQALISEDGMKLIVNATDGDEKKSAERLAQVLDIAKTRYPREDGWLVLDKGRVRESLFISLLSMVPLFVEWMVRAEDKHLFGFLRMLKSQEQPVADFMRKVVAELDNAHRARLEGVAEQTNVNPHIAEVTYHLSNGDLEVIISELLQGVDERYDSAYTSVRLALVRVLDIIKERQFSRVGGAYTFSQNQEA